MKSRREMLEEFLSQDPSDSFSRYALALELEKTGDGQRAKEELERVIAADPAYVGAYYQLGRLLTVRGDIDRARVVYERGLAAAAQANDRRALSELREALDALGSTR